MECTIRSLSEANEPAEKRGSPGSVAGGARFRPVAPPPNPITVGGQQR